MAGPSWSQLDDLTGMVVVDLGDGEAGVDAREQLLAEGHRVGFFQAARTIERLQPEAAPIGGLGPAVEEGVRFRPNLTFAWPATDLAGIREIPCEDGEDLRFEVTCNFLGIYGANSPMPSYITQDLLDQEEEAPLGRQVIDLLNNRLYALLYRIWKKYRSYGEATARSDAWFPQRLGAILGLNDVDCGDLDRATFLRIADIISQDPISAEALQAALRRVLPGIALRIEPCVPTWTPIPGDQRARLGQRNSLLGTDCFLGSLVRNRSTTFAIDIGPLTYLDFLRLLPGGDGNALMAAVVGLLNRNGLDCLVRLSVRALEVPPVRLGHRQQGLGWNTRLGGRPGGAHARHRITFTLQDPRHG